MKKFLLIVFLLISVGNLAFSERLTDEERFKWFHEQTEQGDVDAQYNLGAMYLGGEGVTKNNTEANMWFRKAADQGHATAQAMIGAMYSHGGGEKSCH